MTIVQIGFQGGDLYVPAPQLHIKSSPENIVNHARHKTISSRGAATPGLPKALGTNDDLVLLVLFVIIIRTRIRMNL